MKILPWLCSGILASNFVITSSVKAQITIDGTTNTVLDSNGNSITIDEGDRAGDNLFHSFEQFSIPTGSEAFFNNANDIVNIFSRVTGGDISNIDGLLRANGGANLFIINPAGIVFGEGASLDIGGSFFASSAESIVFSDDFEFFATDTASEPLLTINQPLGLNLGNNPGDIAVNGSTLQVNSGETLALIGGNVTFTAGQIIAPGANIELGGLSAAGEIAIDADSSLNFSEGVARSDVILTNGTYIDVQAGGGGNITVNANNIELSGGELGFSSLFAGIAPNSGSVEAQAGDITLNATGDIDIAQESGIANNIEELGSGDSGSININTTNLNVTEGSYIAADVFGTGNGGTIAIEASDTITVDGEDSLGFASFISSEAIEGEGNAGNIALTTANLFVTNGAFIIASTSTIGTGGNISIDASDTITVDGEDSSGVGSAIASQAKEGEGDAGNINITTANLFVTNGTAIDSSTFTIGKGGDISIDASDTITVDGEDSSGFLSGIRSTTQEREGDAGDIALTTANLLVTNGAVIVASTFTIGKGGNISIDASDTITVDGEDSSGVGSFISSQAGEGEGNAGNIDITTIDLFVTNGAFIDSSTFTIGKGGGISIDASDTITVDGEDSSGFPSLISSVAFGEGDAGDIDLTSANLYLTNIGSISTNTSGIGNAGVITIDASDNIYISGKNSSGFAAGIFSQVEEDAIGEAGGIDITTNNLTLINEGEININSEGEASAGSLLIRANSLSLDNSSLLASTPVGTGGSITLDIADSIIFQNNSLISANAFGNADGGNVTINADSIVAFPSQNNDIIASADRGTGGNIDITTNAIFGLVERSSTPSNTTNNIDASSEFGLDGTISINELEVNPAQGLEELPTEIIDVARLVAENLCQQNRGSEFIVTGKGGIAPSPSQTRDGNVGEVDLVEPVNYGAEEALRLRSGQVEAGEEIIEAQGWIVNDRGTIELVTHQTDTGNFSSQPQKQLCP